MVTGKGIEVDPKNSLQKTLQSIAASATDLTLPLNLIAQQWFKSNRAIFTLKGPGQYADLTPAYKKFKVRHLGSAYPILRLSGALEASLTDPTDGSAVNYIINKVSLALGTRVASAEGAPYGYFLHHGTSKMKARPVVLFGNEQIAPGALKGRVEQWRKIILDHVVREGKKNRG